MHFFNFAESNWTENMANMLARVNGLFKSFERKGWVKRTPAFIYDYHKTYPDFKLLEDNYEEIRKECEGLLSYKDQITNMEGLAGNKTEGGVHSIKWKSFVIKSGKFINKNCEKCPNTADLLKKIPRIKQAFFSILDPEQHIRPHKGYYYGFLRYHLGVIIPENNENNMCWIKINDDLKDNDQNRKDSMENAETYYWKNGEGIIFNDNYLHEAKNESKEVRVVLFIDIARKFPWPIDLFNRFILKIAYWIPEVKQIAQRAEVDFDVKPKYT
ncbi:MAG: aspartyl/asparaginyl beta-hydroxylase domain-containing protein [Ekhidna sp.]|uniref:aspartyl/asparaginyl beta-hydroxylase domain-containing protein n=1 Tax=Ekhidna sp. TaxID=2608089 RepID=UPI0032ED6D7C